jgi:hypothetical protein
LGRDLRIVVDHLTGSRRGQRQELEPGRSYSFGRHPDCDVSFDAHRDLDASSRHAELREADSEFVLVDVGSSNGTFVDGSKISEVAIAPGDSVVAEFGSGGPRVRIYVAEGDEDPPPLPPDPAPTSSSRALFAVLVVALLLLAGSAAILWWP